MAEDVPLASVLARPVAPCRRVLHGGLRACISERFFRGAAQLAGIRGADLVFAGPYPVIVYEQRVLGALVGRLLGGPFAQQHRADRSTRLRNPDRSPCPVRDYEASPARFQIEGVADGSVRSRHAAADRMHVGRKVRSGEKASESRRKGPDAENFLGQPFRDAGAPRMSQARIAALVVDRRAVRSE